MKDIILRKAHIEDSSFLYSLRNDPLSRKNSINQKEISLEEHKNWFQASLKNPKRIIFIAEKEFGNLSEMCRADYKEIFFIELSWIVFPEYRKKGIGTNIVNQAVDLLKKEKMIFQVKIKSENIPSIKIAKSCGFELRKKENGILIFNKEIKE